MEPTRRDVLKIGGLGALGAVGAAVLPWEGTVSAKAASTLPERKMPRPFRAAFVRQPVLRPFRTGRDDDGALVDFYELVERPGRVRILPGLVTTVYGYNGITPGPTIKTPRGRRAVVRVRNHLPAVHPLGHDFHTSVHLHGAASMPQFDGYANDMTPPGFYKEYFYANSQTARTMWYHDHAVHHTTENGYFGLFAQFHVHDEAERALLPQDEFDVPLTIGDAAFASDGSLWFDDHSQSSVMGDVILVNGVPWPVMKVKRRVYRFRFLVASPGRSFRFALDTGDPVVVVASEAGLAPRSREIGQWRQSSGERYEVLFDFRRYRPGQRVVLRNLSNPNNIEYEDTDKVMAFDVTDAPFSKRDGTWRRIPDTLVDSHVMNLKAADAVRTRHFLLERKGGLWTINGSTWQDVVDSDFQLLAADPDLGDVEIWETENKSGGWFHPMHLHQVDYKILSRNGRPPEDYELAPKDTAYLGENETLRLLIEFGPHRGRYMVHCHNMTHEDHDMMVQYAVGWKPGQVDVNDPILAAPAQADNLPRPRV